MKRFYSAVLTGIVTIMLANNSFAQCTLNAGKDDTLTCGEVKQLNLESAWNLVSSGTTQNLNSVHFISQTVGFVCGNAGTLLKTTNGGNSFQSVVLQHAQQLNRVYFSTNNNGYIVGNDGLILKTNNGGTTWDSIYSGVMQSLSVVNFINARVGFVGGQGGVILKTLDSGNTWASSATGITAGQYDNVNDIFFTDSLTGYTTLSSTIYKTVNGGLSWSTLIQNPSFFYRDIHFINKDTGFVCGNGGLYFVLRTTDAGQTWQMASSSNYPYYQVTTDNDNNLLLSGAGVFKSSDLGVTWSEAVTATQIEFTQNNLRFLSVSGKNASSGIAVGTSGKIYVNQLFDSVVWTPSTGLSDSTSRNPYVSTNTSITYFVTARVNGCVATDDITFYVDPLTLSARKLYTVSCGDTAKLGATLNISTSTPGLQFNWTPGMYLSQPNIINPTAVINKNTRYQLKATTQNGCADSVEVDVKLDFDAKIPESIYNITCGKQLQIKTDTNILGKVYFPTNDELEKMFFLNDTIGFVGGWKFLYKTFDGGKTWSNNLIQNDYQVKKIHFRTPLLGYVAAHSNILMRSVILKTTDGGNNWVVQDPLGSGYNLITDIWFTTDLIGYAISNSNPGKILKTVNGGNSWVAVNTNLNNYLYAIWFTNATTGYAVGNGATLLKTTNSGTSWSQITISNISGSPEFHAVTFTSVDTGYIAGAASVWKTTNAGSTWVQVNLPVPQNTNLTINDMLFVDANHGYVVCHYSNMNSPMNGYGAVYQTKDAGATWYRNFNIDSVSVLKSIARVGTNGKLFIGGTGGALLGSLKSPSNFSWSPALGLSSTNISNPFANPTNTSTYILTGSSGNCSVSDTVVVAVNPIKISAGTNQQLACGDSVKLQPRTLYLNIDASRYQSSWVITDSNNVQVLASKSNEITTGYYSFPAGKYKLTLRPDVVPPPLLIKIVPLHSDSISEEIVFTTDTIIEREFTIPDYTNYAFSWLPQQTRINPSTQRQVYTLTLQTPQGCFAQDSVVVDPVPLTINIGGDRMLSCGSSVEMDSIITNYTAPLSAALRWSNPAILNDTLSLKPIVSPTDTTKLIAVLQTDNGCFASDTVEFIVMPFVAFGIDTSIGCLDTVRLRVATDYRGENPLNYQWSPANWVDSANSATPAVVGGKNLKLHLQVSTWNGCVSNDSVEVSLTRSLAANLCIVGVNDINKNQLVWNKNQVKHAIIYDVWRETNVTGQYTKIGSVMDSLSFVFVDSTSNPLVQSNQYMINYVDACEQQSLSSEPHQTMHLTINKGIGNAWNLIWNSYKGFTVSTYNIYRGTDINNLQLIGTSAGSNTAYSDLNAPAGDVYYQVELISPNACNPNKTYNSSRSNKVSNKDVGLNNIMRNDLLQVYPNPTSRTINIVDVNGNLTGAKVLVFDVIGKKVMETTLVGNTVDVALLNNGTYILTMEKEGETFRGKFVRQ